MIPILYESTELEFNTNGLGVLSECTSCLVTWQGNGVYDMEMEYPEDGRMAPEIMASRIILARPTPFRDPQPFRIKRRTESIGGMFTVYAEHVAYDLKGVAVGAYEADGVVVALQRLKENALNDCSFEFWTDKTTTGKFSRLTPSNAWDILGGTSGSILDLYGGQYEFDRWTVRLHKQLGRDSGVMVEYGKNLTTLDMERNIAKLYSGVCPFWANQDKSVVVTCDPKIVPIEGEFDRSNILTLDLSGEWLEAPTPEALLARTKRYISENDLGKPTVALDFSFVQLSKTDEYSWLSRLERCEVFDTVTVRLLKQKIDVTATITETVTNALTERYESIKIGSVRRTISDTVNDQQKEIAKKPDLGLVEQIAGQITGEILGAKGGSVRLIDTDADGKPDTLYIADNEDPAQAKKVWRFNYEGWAASRNGYNGPFTMAASLEYGFYADFITAGIMTANLIRAGVLSSVDGKTFVLDLENGTLSMEATSLTIKGKTVEEIAQGSVGLDNLGVRNYIQNSDVTFTLTSIDSIPVDVELSVANYGALAGKTMTLSVLSDVGGGLGYIGDKVFGVKAVGTWQNPDTLESVKVDYFPDIYYTPESAGTRVFSTDKITSPDGYYNLIGLKVVMSAHMKPSSTRFSFTLSRPKLEIGRIPTDWTPAPEDTAGEIQDAIDGQTQEDIFNKLTNNGQLQGLYMQGGKLYLNATYLAAGTITSTNGASKWDLNSGVIVFSNEKTYKYADYTDDDSTRIRNIVLGTVAPTDADFEKFDIYKDGKITNTDRVIVRNMMNNKQNLTVKWECKFSSATPGKLISVTVTNMSTGKSHTIFELGNQNRISLQSGENLSNTGLLDYIYPVGSIYMSVNSNNPGMVFGGSWVPWGTGRVPVGVDTGDGSFNTVEKTGGEKTHKLTTNEMPSHGHQTNITLGNRTQSGSGIWAAAPGEVDSTWVGYAGRVGRSAAHNNLQPYITCYMWKRTA